MAAHAPHYLPALRASTRSSSTCSSLTEKKGRLLAQHESCLICLSKRIPRRRQLLKALKVSVVKVAKKTAKTIAGRTMPVCTKASPWDHSEDEHHGFTHPQAPFTDSSIASSAASSSSRSFAPLHIAPIFLNTSSRVRLFAPAAVPKPQSVHAMIGA